MSSVCRINLWYTVIVCDVRIGNRTSGFAISAIPMIPTTVVPTATQTAVFPCTYYTHGKNSIIFLYTHVHAYILNKCLSRHINVKYIHTYIHTYKKQVHNWGIFEPPNSTSFLAPHLTALYCYCS